jgi:hypothetical protein
MQNKDYKRSGLQVLIGKPNATYCVCTLSPINAPAVVLASPFLFFLLCNFAIRMRFYERFWWHAMGGYIVFRSILHECCVFVVLVSALRLMKNGLIDVHLTRLLGGIVWGTRKYVGQSK